VFEDSAVIASHAGTRLEATGARGFALLEIDPTALDLQSDNFVARGVRITVLAPGDSADLQSGAVTRAGPTDAAAALLDTLLADLVREAGPDAPQGRGTRVPTLTFHHGTAGTAVLDLEFPRDEDD
jgi:hypothetical protein